MNGMDLLKPIIDAANRNNAQADGVVVKLFWNTCG